ncbi:hypothetical protein [Blastomonas sp.]|uniref:hypothetical protein n=1 Tax=Blastomonas sp. TaxID=1909299 RepID=UPI00359452C1
MTVLAILFRRLLLPTLIATLVGRFTFNVAQTGEVDIANTFVDAMDAGYTFFMVLVILSGVTLVAYALRALRMSVWFRMPVLLLTAAGTGFALVLYLTEVVAYAELVYAPAVAACLVWMACNIDLLKRVNKGAHHG